jgi:serine O-acetyltransferase
MRIAALDDLNARPSIGNRMHIWVGAVILGDIMVIGANAVVIRDVPPGHSAMGVPARIRPRGKTA